MTETWLKDADCLARTEATPSGYTMCDFVRPEGRGGGVGLICRSEYKPYLTKSGNKNSFEFAEFIIILNNIKFFIVMIYRPPYSTARPFTIASFINEFSVYLDTISFNSNNLIICGDFNIHVDVIENFYINSSFCLLDSFNLTNNVCFPTYIIFNYNQIF